MAKYFISCESKVAYKLSKNDPECSKSCLFDAFLAYFSCFFRHRFLHRFLASMLNDLGTHFGTLGPPFGTKLGPSGAPNRPSGAKRLEKSIRRAHFLRVLERTCFQYRALTLPSTILDGFGTDLGIIFLCFLRFCEPNFAKTQNFLNTKREAKSQPRT